MVVQAVTEKTESVMYGAETARSQYRADGKPVEARPIIPSGYLNASYDDSFACVSGKL